MRAVAIGGGHGLHRCLRALVHLGVTPTAVVTTADDGGSSGRLRRALGVIPPGDLRMALAALVPDPEVAALLQYRFETGELAGHSLGNLVLVAAADLAGGMVPALDRLGAYLRCRGRVLPCSPVPLTLCAEVDGRILRGQVRVATTGRIRRVWVEPRDPPAVPEAVAAIAAADVVVLGPGSLFTSVLPNLLVPDIARAVVETRARRVLVANLREQRGETEGMTLVDHLAALTSHVPGLRIDAVVAHDGPAPHGDGAPLLADPQALAPYTATVRTADLLDGRDGHDPERLAAVLGELLGVG